MKYLEHSLPPNDFESIDTDPEALSKLTGVVSTEEIADAVDIDENVTRSMIEAHLNELPDGVTAVRDQREPSKIEELRSDDELEVVSIKGRVEHITQIYSCKDSIQYGCVKCGQVYNMTQDTCAEKILDPGYCQRNNCGSKTFKEYNISRSDKRMAVIKDLPDGNTSEPQDIVAHLFEPHLNKLDSGDTVQITGIVRHIDVDNEDNKNEREIVVTHVENETQELELVVDSEEKEQFNELAQSDNLEQILIDSLAPHLEGIDYLKRAVLYSIASNGGSESIRGNSHILMIGDPSTGKSKLVQEAHKIIPRAEMTDGGGSTGVGLTAAVTNHEKLGWMVSQGAMVRANNSVVFVDELDELREEDLGRLLTALESGEIHVDKSSISQTLPAKTTFIGAANPENGIYNPNKPIKEQFDFPSALLSRMDLIYPIEDQVGDNDEQIAREISQQFTDNVNELDDRLLSTEKLKRYMYLVRNTKTSLSEDAVDYVSEIYQKLRQETNGEIDTRDSAAICRLAIASARLRLKSKARTEDVERAVEILIDSLERLGNGKIDTTARYAGMTEEDIQAREIIEEIVQDIFPTMTTKDATKENIIEYASEKGINEEKAEHYIDKKLKNGRFYRDNTGEIRSAV